MNDNKPKSKARMDLHPNEISDLRDQFAMSAMTGHLANPIAKYTIEDRASLAYKCADAMLAARAKDVQG